MIQIVPPSTRLPRLRLLTLCLAQIRRFHLFLPNLPHLSRLHKRGSMTGMAQIALLP